MSAAKTKSKKKTQLPQRKMKGLLLIAVSIIVLLMIVLWSSLFKSYPVEGKKQLLAINSGDTYSGFIDRLAKEDMASFPIILKLYQKIFIHDTLKAGVYEVREGMSIRQVLDMISNVDNAEMNRILVIEGTTFKQLIEALKKDALVTKEVSNLPMDQLLKALDIPYTHAEGLFAPDTYFFAKGESDKKILTDLYKRQMKALDEAWANRAALHPD